MSGNPPSNFVVLLLLMWFVRIRRKIPCNRSVSIPPILEGDTDNWEEDDNQDRENKKQSRKR